MHRECLGRFPRHRLQRRPLVSDPGMHHGTCDTHVPWCMSGSLTRGDGKTFPAFPAHSLPAILRIWQTFFSITGSQQRDIVRPRGARYVLSESSCIAKTFLGYVIGRHDYMKGSTLLLENVTGLSMMLPFIMVFWNWHTAIPECFDNLVCIDAWKTVTPVVRGHGYQKYICISQMLLVPY